MESQVYANGRFLRKGYTTGSCAAAASKAAVEALLTGVVPETAEITLPDGTLLCLKIEEGTVDGITAECGVVKDGGDDPDTTHGLLIKARAERINGATVIDGGEGVGRVTKQGLDQPVGAAAINSVPRAMILRAVTDAASELGYDGGFSIVISIPGGEEIAERTFNPKLGIKGGLSVLGTTGIVMPMSNKALADTVRLEIKMLAASGFRHCLLTPGNYGTAFIRGVLGLNPDAAVKCSNFIGDALDAAAEHGFTRVLVVGHIGKLVKLGIGAMNTHSASGDGRIETLIACALEAGAELDTLREISRCVTTDAALAVLRAAGVFDKTMDELKRRVGDTLRGRVPETAEIGSICFSGAEILFKSENAEELCKLWYIS